MAPMTRYRASDDHVPNPLAQEYYTQRAHTPGTLIITEGTYIDDRAGGQPNAPGIWNDEQIAAWKPIVDKVHSSGSFMVVQLWALGRSAHPEVLAAKGHPYVSASDVQLSHRSSPPRPLTKAEIAEYVQLYATAATNAIKAGFDGVEIHSANGYLLDQFLSTASNARDDEYGGSVENRIRFAKEVVDAIAGAIASNRTAIRFSPWGTFQDMGMADPRPTYTALVEYLKDSHPDLAYIHVVEPEVEGKRVEDVVHSNAFIHDIWSPRPLIRTGGFDKETALAAARSKDTLVGFARNYLATPDLVYRLKNGIELNTPDRATFYQGGEKGYIDYPFADSATL
ncbi:unnamed protein product [Peniophora sp. CBMAI 1063]|nr:unnamed protein product [Peniophora sp. CBMAI 1063]